MSKNFFRAKNGLNVAPTDASSVVNPEVGDIIVDSSDNNKLKRYDDVTASWKDVGSGVGGINYISTNSDFEGGTTGYVVYKDAAAESPVDATSGTALYTSISATTSSPLRGTKSGLISKTANDAQGEGVSYDFTIDSADQAQVLRISFDYSTSTNYADGDIRVYVYDVFNSRLIEVIDRDLYASSFGKFVGTFQTSPDSTSYRLIFHIASTNALAYTVTVDNVLVGPQTIVKGAIVTDWKEFTPEINQTTNITPTGYWRRVGSNAEFSLRLDFGGAVPSTSLIFVLPNSLSIDYSKIVTQTDGVTRLDSTGQFYDASAVATANAWDICAFASGGSTAVRFIYNAADDFRQFNPASAPVAVAAGDILTLNLKVPILGWSSNVVLSEDAGNREIVASAYLGTAANHTSSGSALLVPLDSELFDTTSSFDSVTSKLFTVPESGYYDISGAVSFNSILTGFTQSEVFINGVPQIRGSRIQGNPTVGAIRSVVSGILLLNKGDTIGLYATQNESASEPYVTGKENTYLHIAKRSSPQTIAASEVVACRYTTNTPQSVVNNQPIVYEDLVYDTHNAYDTATGTWTCPQSGWYRVEAKAMTASISASINQVFVIFISDGTGTYDYSTNTTAKAYNSILSSTNYYSKGDTVLIRMGSTLPAVNLTGTATQNFMSITKVNGVS